MDNFIKNITDKKGREITIGGNGNNIVAEHDGFEIGCFEFDIQENEHSCSDILTNCNIDSNYQRSSIGTALILLAEEWFEDFCIVDHFSNEGAEFLTYCIDKKVFKKKHKKVKDDRY